jgi:KaiC/GvpD/RAD55 family RecA-like ATPase
MADDISPALKNIKGIVKERAERKEEWIFRKEDFPSLSSKPQKYEYAKVGDYIKTGVKGLDEMIEKGIPKGHAVLIAGGAGSGKTILSLQIINSGCSEGKKCLYMSFEESEESLRQHMRDFGWDASVFEKKRLLVIRRSSIFDINRSLEAMVAKSKGELLIDVSPIILPEGFVPDIIIVDSLTAIASAFTGKETYRSYIEHLFRYFEEMGITSFLITETDQMPTVFSPTGAEEFLADGVIVLYNIRKGDIRENAIEILKMRGVKHSKKIVAMRIVAKSGVEIYPEQEIFSGI